MHGRSQAGKYLTRRTFLEVALLGGTRALLDSCGRLPGQPIEKGVAPSRVARGERISQGLPSSMIPEGLGINIHFTGPQQRDIERISAARFAFVRLDFPWADIERQKGVYDLSGYETLVRAFAQQGIRSLIILAYGNPLYDSSSAPFHMGPNTGEVRQAFARFAAAAAAKFKGQKIIWEMWSQIPLPKGEWLASGLHLNSVHQRACTASASSTDASRPPSRGRWHRAVRQATRPCSAMPTKDRHVTRRERFYKKPCAS